MAQAPNTPDFNGTWELNRSENLDAYLKDEGWGLLKRKAAGLASATQIIKHVDNKMTVRVINPRGDTTYEFTCDGKEFEYKDADGSDMKASATWDDDRQKLTEATVKTTKNKETKKITMVRYIKNDEMYLELINGNGVKCIRIFKKKN